MKKGWEVRPLGKVISLEYGKPLPKEDRKPDGKYPVFGANGEKTRSDKFYAEGPGIIIGRKGSAGEITLTEENFWPLDVTYFVTFDREQLDRIFLYHLLSLADLPSLATGVKPGINRNNVYDLIAEIPPLDEQKQIVAVLDEALDGLASARTNAEANLQNAQDLCDGYIAAFFEQGGNLWPRKSLSEISENLDRMRVPITKKDRVFGDVPYYGASGVVDHVADYIFDEDLLLVSEDGANLLARSYPIAFSISGRSWVNNHAHVLRFDDLETQEFVRIYLNSISLKPYVSGMAQPKLNQASLNKIPILFPECEVRAEFVANSANIVNETKRLSDYYQQTLLDLEQLKQSLLQKAFAGELT